MTTIANQTRPDVLAKARPLLEARLATETFAPGRVLLIEALAITRTGLVNRSDELEQLLMEALRASPRAVDWSFLLELSTPQSRVSIARTAAAWNAREPYPAWLDYGLDEVQSLPLLRRAWELHGFESDSYVVYARAATLAGYREEASAVAGATSTPRSPRWPRCSVCSRR